MALRLATAPEVEPIELTDLKPFLRIVGDDQDGVLALLLSAAREHGEAETRRAWITQEWEMTLDRFPCKGGGLIEIPLPPLQSVESIEYTGADGTEQTLDSVDYVVDTDSEPGRVVPAYGKSWPSTLSVPNAVRIAFTAGYGDAGSDVPAPLRSWLQARVGTLYENREEIVVGRSVETLPRSFIDGLLDPFRIITFP